MTDRGRVAIVGGGLAGIATALDCAAAGADVTLLEVRPRLGGAAYSFERDGLSIDNGQHVFLRCCTAYRDLLARLGADRDVVLQERLDIPVLRPDGRRGRLSRTGLPAPLHLSLSLSRYRLLTLGQRARLPFAMLALGRVDVNDPAADAQPFGDWLAAHGQGRAEIDAIWRLIILPTLNIEPEQASLAQVAQVFQVGLLNDATAGDIGYARVPLSQLHDVPARRALSRAGVDVRLGWRAERVVPGDGAGDAALRVEGLDQTTVEADAVVVAVPHGRAAGLLPPEAGVDAAKLDQLGASPIVNVHVLYDRPVLDQPFVAGVDTPVQFLFDRTEQSGVGSGQYVAVSVSGADQEQATDPETLRDQYVRAIAELLPAAREARVEHAFVTREHAATFRAEAGQRALRPGSRTALPGVFLAGSWTDTGWPATMEGAVRSGRAAAGDVLRTLPRRARETVTT